MIMDKVLRKIVQNVETDQRHSVLNRYLLYSYCVQEDQKHSPLGFLAPCAARVTLISFEDKNSIQDQEQEQDNYTIWPPGLQHTNLWQNLSKSTDDWN